MGNYKELLQTIEKSETFLSKSFFIGEELHEEEQRMFEQNESKEEKVVVISVDCEETETNILGYDFLVREREVESMRRFITKAIKTNGQPLLRIHVQYNKRFSTEQVWDKKNIEKCISEGYK